MEGWMDRWMDGDNKGVFYRKLVFYDCEAGYAVSVRLFPHLMLEPEVHMEDLLEGKIMNRLEPTSVNHNPTSLY